MRLTISPTNRFFLADGRPFFYLGDTVWSAFTNPTLEEWRHYLAYRRRQGFNTLQISILPILHDASESDLEYTPFARGADGQWDFSAPSAAYFEHAAELLAAARDEGFIPALVLLWCNYVPNTWASKRHPDAIMPLDAVAGYVQYVANAFARFDPIFIVSGDTDFVAPESSQHYRTALHTIKQLCPEALTTMHLAPQADLPDEFVRSSELDFYMFQSGHHIEEESRAYVLAERFSTKVVTKPVVNGEPAYEGHGHGFQYARFSAPEVRRATWQSLLSGASAGVTYGAHGIWSWHRSGNAFTSVAFSMYPFDWHDALHLEGAWDISFARALFERYDLFGLESRQDLLVDAPPAIRAAASVGEECVAVYVPWATEVMVELNGSVYQWSTINLATRRWEDTLVTARRKRTVIGMQRSNGDMVAIGKRLS